jgi:Cell wall-active antibiotics response 4TMS YvqF/Domain of unknown function (DUF5668)
MADDNQPDTSSVPTEGSENATGGARRSAVCRRGFSGGLFWGVLVVCVGLIFLFDQLGIASADHLFRFFWPAIFLFFGVEALLRPGGSGRLWGMILTTIGLLLLLESLRVGVMWPLLIIFWGVWILMRTLGYGPRWDGRWFNQRADWFRHGLKSGSSEAELDYTLIFSGIKRRVTTKNFVGGKMVAVFGGFNLDLRKAEIEGSEAEIHVDAVFGGGEIRVPETWHVSVRAAAILGGFVDETRPPYDLGPKTKRLVITGSAVFGGVSVKN